MVDKEFKRTRLMWWFALGAVWFALFFLIGKSKEAAVEAELAKLSGVSRWWHEGGLIGESDATKAMGPWLGAAIVGAALMFIPAHVIAGIRLQQIASAEEAARRQHDERERESERAALAANVKAIEDDSATATAAGKLARSKQEIITRLGNVDQFVRILEHESSSDRRIVALQSAHSELVTISSKLAAGEIIHEALADERVRNHAIETNRELRRIGLAKDRINRDLVALFKPKQAGGASDAIAEA
jgi:hypothetical protein